MYELRRGQEPPPYPGIASCYIEFGGSEVAVFSVNFLEKDAPFGTFSAPSVEVASAKKEFGASRRKRWFDS